MIYKLRNGKVVRRGEHVNRAINVTPRKPTKKVTKLRKSQSSVVTQRTNIFITLGNCDVCSKQIVSTDDFIVCSVLACSTLVHKQCLSDQQKESDCCVFCMNASRIFLSGTYTDKNKASEKKEVNSVIVAATHMLDISPDSRILVLDGPESHTRQYIESANIQCVLLICNASTKDADAIKKTIKKSKSNAVVLCEKIEYTLANAYQNNCMFRVIYLDYCNSWGGNDQMRVQEGLFRAVLNLTPDVCIIGLTCSVRGGESNKVPLLPFWIRTIVQRAGRVMGKILYQKAYSGAMYSIVFTIHSIDRTLPNPFIVWKKERLMIQSLDVSTETKETTAPFELSPTEVPLGNKQIRGYGNACCYIGKQYCYQNQKYIVTSVHDYNVEEKCGHFLLKGTSLGAADNKIVCCKEIMSVSRKSLYKEIK